jgi:hypothetical protein
MSGHYPMAGAPSMFAPLSDSGGTEPIYLPMGELPAGFVASPVQGGLPAGFVATSPVTQYGGGPVVPDNMPQYSGPVIPGHMPSQYGSGGGGPVVPGQAPQFTNFGALGPPPQGYNAGWGAPPQHGGYATGSDEEIVVPSRGSRTPTDDGMSYGYHSAGSMGPSPVDDYPDENPAPIPVPSPMEPAVRLPNEYYASAPESMHSRQRSGGESSIGRSEGSGGRYRVRADDDSGSELSSGLASEANTLTTPPPRAPRSPLMPLHGTDELPPPPTRGPAPGTHRGPPLPVPYREEILPVPPTHPRRHAREGAHAGRTPAAYAEAPLPPDVMYPDEIGRPQTAQSVRSSGTTRTARTGTTGRSGAAGGRDSAGWGRAPPPMVPSTSAGGDSPRSAAGSLAGGSVVGGSVAGSVPGSEYSARGWAANAGHTPAPRLGTIDERR